MYLPGLSLGISFVSPPQYQTNRSTGQDAVEGMSRLPTCPAGLRQFMLLSAFALLTSPAHASANLAPSNLTHSRLDAIKRWSDLSLHDSLTLQEMSDTLASLLLNEASTFTIRGVGTYTGPESILEYLLITRPQCLHVLYTVT